MTFHKLFNDREEGITSVAVIVAYKFPSRDTNNGGRIQSNGLNCFHIISSFLKLFVHFIDYDP